MKTCTVQNSSKIQQFRNIKNKVMYETRVVILGLAVVVPCFLSFWVMGTRKIEMKFLNSTSVFKHDYEKKKWKNDNENDTT